MPRKSWSGWYPPPSRPRPAEGIRARSQRGAIGERWWSRRFVEILESLNLGGRLTRGRSYARGGQVLELEVGPGEVRARVQGSRVRPYRVGIRVLPLSEKDWVRVEEAMATRALFLAKLLAGEMPQRIEEAFAACRLSLFPASPRDLTTECTCPDWENPCKHIAATYYLLAEAFDDDPFLIFRLRGRDKEELLERLRRRRGGGSEAAGAAWIVSSEAAPLEGLVARFWEAGDGLDEIRSRPASGAPPDALLRQLGSPAIEAGGRGLEEILGPAYESMAEAAEHAASRAPWSVEEEHGDRPPSRRRSTRPGR